MKQVIIFTIACVSIVVMVLSLVLTSDQCGDEAALSGYTSTVITVPAE